jgi:hypothetical protein
MYPPYIAGISWYCTTARPSIHPAWLLHILYPRFYVSLAQAVSAPLHHVGPCLLLQLPTTSLGDKTREFPPSAAKQGSVSHTLASHMLNKRVPLHSTFQSPCIEKKKLKQDHATSNFSSQSHGYINSINNARDMCCNDDKRGAERERERRRRRRRGSCPTYRTDLPKSDRCKGPLRVVITNMHDAFYQSDIERKRHHITRSRFRIHTRTHTHSKTRRGKRNNHFAPTWQSLHHNSVISIA